MEIYLTLAPGIFEFYGKSFSVRNKIELKTGDVAYLDAASAEWPSVFLEIISGAAVLRHATKPAVGSAVVRPESPLRGGELIEIRRNKTCALNFSSTVRKDKKGHERFARQRARLVGYVFGEPKQFSVGLTVREEYGFSFAAISDPDSFHYPDLVQLRKYGLFDKVDNSTETLSGGESHRLNLACAIDIGAPILICDLGASNLDREFIQWLEEKISSLSQGRIIVIYNSRRPDFLKTANRFISIKGKEVVEVTPGVVAARQQTLEHHLIVERSGHEEEVLLKVENVYVPGRSLPVSFQLRAGQIRLVLGNNGAGKTTLGKILTDQIDRRLYRGDVFWRTRETKRLMTFQYPSSFPSQIRVNSICNDADLAELDLVDFSEAFFCDLPLGYQKLLYLLRMLSAPVDLFILDEPFAEIDAEYIPFLIRRIMGKKSAAFLICNHDPMVSGVDPIYLGI